MGWILRTEPPAEEPHEFCDKPRRGDPVGFLSGKADGEPGDLWRCDVCGKLWTVNAWNNWRLAGWWLRWLYRREGFAAENAGERSQ